MSDFNFNFKEGDKVYFPTASNKIVKLEECEIEGFPLAIYCDEGSDSFTTKGKIFENNSNPSIFPATQEWYDKLVHVFPNLEKPHTKKTPREIIQAMLDDGCDCVPCFVSDDDEMTAIKKGDKVLIDMGNIDCWDFCIPFHHKTSKIIVDYIDGKEVLEG